MSVDPKPQNNNDNNDLWLSKCLIVVVCFGETLVLLSSIFVLIPGLVFLLICKGIAPIILTDDEEMVNIDSE